jgi:tetratricopeptide (TPR) repeat protein
VPTLSGVVHAQPSPGSGIATASASKVAPVAAGSASLVRARAAWEKGEFDVAEILYGDAVDRGGLDSRALLEAFVHLGAARAVMGKRDGALAAFRRACLLDPDFKTPSEAGKKADRLAQSAKKDPARIGPFIVLLDVPETTDAQRPFRVRASLDAVHATIAPRLGIEAREPISGAQYSAVLAAGDGVAFDLPGSLAVPDATVIVRALALDAVNNTYAVSEGRVRIAGKDAPVAAAPSGERSSGGGFWSSPWPYVLGGLAVAGVGAGLYVALRPATEIAVGPPIVAGGTL